VDAHYILEAGVLGDIAGSLDDIAELAASRETFTAANLRETIVEEHTVHNDDVSFPLKPQKIISDLREVLAPEDIVISDVGAHKMWMAHLYQAERPNTCIISNGFSSMGIGVPGAIGAKIAHPDRTALTVTGDAGFLMNSQEIGTALRIGTAIVILVWTDSEYGLIKWHQLRRYERESNIKFKTRILCSMHRVMVRKAIASRRLINWFPFCNRRLTMTRWWLSIVRWITPRT
jgi:acetolactate synthase-1/2/3 large subunit